MSIEGSRAQSLNDSTIDNDVDDAGVSLKKAYNDPNKMTPYVMKYSKWKWLVLILGSLITFGDWYCMDNVAVLE